MQRKEAFQWAFLFFLLRATPKAFQRPFFIFAFALNAKSFAAAIFVFFFHFSFHAMILDDWEKLFVSALSFITKDTV